jgi:hypothetical protein
VRGGRAAGPGTSSKRSLLPATMEWRAQDSRSLLRDRWE